MLPYLVALVAAAPIAAKHNPAVGSAERQAILAALRPSVEKTFGVPVEFVPHALCVADGTALVIADPRRRGGAPIPWQRAMSRDVYEIGGVEVSAILRFRGGRWALVKSEIGATDVWYEGLLPPGLASGC